MRPQVGEHCVKDTKEEEDGTYDLGVYGVIPLGRIPLSRVPLSRIL